MTQRVVLVPIRDFDGMTRLASTLSPQARRELALRLADHLVACCADAGLEVAVVTGHDDVRSWAREHDILLIDDACAGLDAACGSAVESVEGAPWMVVHADLPLASAAALRAAADIEGTVLVPSMDGGTNIIAHTGRFPFSFGEGSFQRHLARNPRAAVVPSSALSVEIDTPEHWHALAESGLAPSLAPG